MKEVFPISKIINHKFLASDILLPVGLKGTEVIVDVERENNSFPSKNRKKDVS